MSMKLRIQFEPWTEDDDTIDFNVYSLTRAEARICVSDVDGFRTISEPIDITTHSIEVVERSSGSKVSEDIKEFDDWYYKVDPNTGVGIVLNIFQDAEDTGTGPQVNVYTVSKEDQAHRRWHDHMKLMDFNINPIPTEQSAQ